MTTVAVGVSPDNLACQQWHRRFDDNPATPNALKSPDNEAAFEKWISCNHRLIYHYDHYVTARENVFLPCTIRGVRHTTLSLQCSLGSTALVFSSPSFCALTPV